MLVKIWRNKEEIYKKVQPVSKENGLPSIFVKNRNDCYFTS